MCWINAIFRLVKNNTILRGKCVAGIEKATNAYKVLAGKIKENTSNLMYACPCIIYENDERYQLDVTILFIIINISTCFGHLYAHLQEYIGCILQHMVFSTRCCG